VDPFANANLAAEVAAHHGHVDVVRYLCELPHGAIADVRTAALKAAAGNGEVDTVRCVWELVEPSTAMWRAGFLRAASTGHVDVMRYLWGQRDDPTAWPTTSVTDWCVPLDLAAEGDHIDAVRFMCDLPDGPGLELLLYSVDDAVLFPWTAYVRYVLRAYVPPLRMDWFQATTRASVHGREVETRVARTPLLALRCMLRQGRARPLVRYATRHTARTHAGKPAAVRGHHTHRPALDKVRGSDGCTE